MVPLAVQHGVAGFSGKAASAETGRVVHQVALALGQTEAHQALPGEVCQYTLVILPQTTPGAEPPKSFRPGTPTDAHPPKGVLSSGQWPARCQQAKQNIRAATSNQRRPWTPPRSIAIDTATDREDDGSAQA